ncbi:MAG: HAD family hydrolase [Prevotellaceae bacterium]|nr:HAD family hydrolase [Prevotellaceae bacterium]MDY6129966.1 HAD family hydrolase [Prevotella sp.]
MSVQGYVFDYGGTLDTRGMHWGKVIWHAFEKFGVPVSEEQFRQAYIYAERTLGRNPIIRPTFTFRKLLDVKLRLQLEYLCMKGYLTTDKTGLEKTLLDLLAYLYANVQETVGHSRKVLSELHEHFPLVLVSNFYGNIEVVLQEFGMGHLFEKVIESAVVGIRKPDSRIFQLGVEAMGISSEHVAVVGDSISKDIVPARSIGCQTIWYKGEGWTDTLEDESVPHRIIHDLDDLINPES